MFFVWPGRTIAPFFETFFQIFGPDDSAMDCMLFDWPGPDDSAMDCMFFQIFGPDDSTYYCMFCLAGWGWSGGVRQRLYIFLTFLIATRIPVAPHIFAPAGGLCVACRNQQPSKKMRNIVRFQEFRVSRGCGSFCEVFSRISEVPGMEHIL